jgi:predicted TIM-barrel fold metal-dependent hydrolase
MRTYQVISGDGHVEVPLDWSTRVPGKYREYAPHLVRNLDGTETWIMDEWKRDCIGNLYCGLRYDEFTPKTAPTYHHPDGSPRPGAGDPVQRLREQDQDGIDAEILYYPIYGPRLMAKMIAKDPKCYLALIQAYNTFLAQEYCSAAPDRLLGMALVPETGIHDAVAELQRCRKMGLRGATLTMWPNGSPDPKPEDDRFWSAVMDLDMKMAAHVNFGGPPHMVEGVTAESTVCGTLQAGPSCGTIGRLILYVFDKFPGLRFYFAETQAGWLPHALNWVDEFYLRWYSYFDLKLKKMPSQFWRDHCLFGFVHDRLAMKLRDYSSSDMLIWGSDFPHSQGTYPDSKEILTELLEDVPQADRRKVLVSNACAFLGLDERAPITETP